MSIGRLISSGLQWIFLLPLTNFSSLPNRFYEEDSAKRTCYKLWTVSKPLQSEECIVIELDISVAIKVSVGVAAC